jgi:probable HAF family extracellular repeat protein
MGLLHRPLRWRRFCRALAVAVAAGLALAGGVPAAAAPAITATVLVGLDGRSFQPIEMNERGQVLGVHVGPADSPPVGRMLVWQDGAARAVAPGRVGLPLALSERGDVAGALLAAPDGPTVGFVVGPRGRLTTIADADPAVTVVVADVDRFGDALVQRIGPATTTTGLLRHGAESTLLVARPNAASPSGDINDRRRVAGTAGTGAFTTTARSALLALGDLGGGDATAWAISDRGLVVGRSTDASGLVRAVVWPVGQTQPVDLGTLGGPTSTTGLTTLIVPTSLVALGGALNRHVVNAAGDVIGTSAVPGVDGGHGFVWRNGHMTDLGTLPGCTSVQPTAIGEGGDVVGLCTGPAGGRAFRWRDDQLIDLGATAEVGVPLDVDRGGTILAYHAAPDGDPIATLITVRD